MIANHIHDALAQVRRLQEVVLERRNFHGYSGIARGLSGTVALGGAMVLSGKDFPRSYLDHLAGWAVVLILALAVNYGALAFWFLFNPRVKRRFLELTPAVDAVPALAVGAAMSSALVMHGLYHLLFGTWMCLYGLAHVSYRQSLPRANYLVGLYYALCGAVCLLWPGVSFFNPWPMGLVFFAGEWAGGIVLYRNNLGKKEG